MQPFGIQAKNSTYLMPHLVRNCETVLEVGKHENRLMTENRIIWLVQNYDGSVQVALYVVRYEKMYKDNSLRLQNIISFFPVISKMLCFFQFSKQ